ncbi:MAG: hypothetical protein R3A47_01795 [Polyangiales bacterium]
MRPRVRNTNTRLQHAVEYLRGNVADADCSDDATPNCIDNACVDCSTAGTCPLSIALHSDDISYLDFDEATTNYSVDSSSCSAR